MRYFIIFSMIVFLSLIFSSVFGKGEAYFPLSGKSVIDEKEILLSGQLEGAETTTVVVFLSARCPCSNRHIGEIQSLKSEYPQYQFIAVSANPEETLEEVKKYFQEKEIGFPILRDQSQSLANKFKANKTPHAFVLNSKGNLLYAGGVTSSHDPESAQHKYLREALSDISEGKKVRVTETRSLGCTITRE